MTVAFVLSGGGARGDFEVGARRYLYDQGLKPDIVCGCSVGAINGAKLCEGAAPDGTSAISGLENIWLSLNNNEDMWLTEDWLKNIQNSKVREFFKQSFLQMAGAVALEGWKFWFFSPWALYGLLRTGLDVNDFQRDIEKLLQAKSLFNLNPILGKLSKPENLRPERIPTSGIKMRLGMVSLETAKLRYLTEGGELLESDNATKVLPPVMVPDPACQDIAGSIESDKQGKADLQADLQIAAPGEKPALVSQIRRLDARIRQEQAALNACMIDHPPTPAPSVVSTVWGVLASASIPFAFPPVKLGAENYVDGGVREILPIEVALKMQADTIYAIVASSTVVTAATKFGTEDRQPLPSFDSANLADIAQRVSEEIMTDETLLNEINPPPKGWGPGVAVIQRNVDIHDIMTIEPGLIRIRMAHGYMRADDVLQAKQQNPGDFQKLADTLSTERKTNEIVLLRKAIWDLEYDANGRNPKDDKPLPSGAVVGAKEQVRQMNKDLKTLVEQRIQAGGKVPADIEIWWKDWEKHRWPPNGPLWTDDPFAPTMTVIIQPATTPLESTIQVIVTAEDAATHQNIPSGQVVIHNFSANGHQKVLVKHALGETFPSDSAHGQDLRAGGARMDTGRRAHGKRDGRGLPGSGNPVQFLKSRSLSGTG